MQVNVLIPVHNRIDLTLECLDYLAQQTYKDIKIIVVDDGSTDGTFERIKEKYQDVAVLRGDGNLWWTGAMCMGVEHVLKFAKEGDFILSLNNDTAFNPDFVESLVRTSIQYGRAIVGPMQVDYHNRNNILDRGAWIDWKTYYFDVKTGLPENEKEICNEHVNVLQGRGMLIPVEVFRKIGNFNKDRFPHYIADYDFTMRAFNAGIKLILSYKSIIYTRTDITGISIKEDRPLTLKEAYVNFFSIKSANNIMDHVNFINSNCPKGYRKKVICTMILSVFLKLKVFQPIAKPALFVGRQVKYLIKSTTAQKAGA